MTKRIPSLNWLRVFEAAARSGSFARAAERLAMSPPAVSQQVRALEAHLGRALFDRAPAGVTLTEAGRALLVVVGDALGRMERAADALSTPRRPLVTVGVSLVLSVGWLAPRLPMFAAAHPDIALDLFSLIGRPEASPRNAALWIVFGEPSPGMDSHLLFGERLIPVARPDIAAQLTVREDVLAHTLIEVSDHRRNWTQVLGDEVMPARARTLQVDTTVTALTLAGAGAGIALARAPASDHLIKTFGLAPCLPEMEIDGIEHYHVVSAVGQPLSRDEQTFRDWVIAQAR